MKRILVPLLCAAALCLTANAFAMPLDPSKVAAPDISRVLAIETGPVAEDLSDVSPLQDISVPDVSPVAGVRVFTHNEGASHMAPDTGPLDMPIKLHAPIEMAPDTVSAPLPKYGLDGKMLAQVDKAFTYHPPKDDQGFRYKRIRDEAKGLALRIASDCPPSRETSLALTKLEESVMWANAAIARNES